MDKKIEFSPSCPFPFNEYPRVVMAHGGGGRLMKRLLDELIVPTLCASNDTGMHDAALFILPENKKPAMTTDSFVVKPLEFPGGDIGCLSIYGTVNDLVMAGAMPAVISVGLILEEGLDMQTLWRLLRSMRRAADECHVRIITGDTKVVDRGKGDGLYINTAGIGFIENPVDIHPRRIQEGDVLLVNGDLGRHAIAVMAQREGLRFDTIIESDCASLAPSVQALLSAGVDIHCLRDLTRGGLASALNELAASSNLSFELDEDVIPVLPEVRAACELLGLDPLYAACEGRFIGVLPAKQAEASMEQLQKIDPALENRIIGRVVRRTAAPVYMRGRFGGTRVLDMLSGEQLPRIC
jgi:hydrogenase expression/formation protein HypE